MSESSNVWIHPTFDKKQFSGFRRLPNDTDGPDTINFHRKGGKGAKRVNKCNHGLTRHSQWRLPVRGWRLVKQVETWISQYERSWLRVFEVSEPFKTLQRSTLYSEKI